jgi:hypothetical protein
MNTYQIGDIVDVEAGPHGLWEYIGTGVVRFTGDWICWVEMEDGENKRVHIAQLRLKARAK